MDAPQYVYVDVPSDVQVAWMFYYTHHSDMDAPQYVHVDVLSKSFRDWMFYYTHHSDMYVPKYVSPGAVPRHPAP